MNFWVLWVQEAFFSYLIPDSSGRSVSAAFQTVSTVYFIEGISRTDLWSQGTQWAPKLTL